MARRAFSSSSSALPCSRRLGAGAAGALALSVAPVAAAGAAAAGRLAGVTGPPRPYIKNQNAPAAISVAASAAPISTNRGLLPASSSSGSRGWRRKAPMVRSLAAARVVRDVGTALPASASGWGLAGLDAGGQPREYPALERGSQLLLGRPVREDQHPGARPLRLRGVDGGAHVGDLARVDRQALAAFGARHAAQGLLEGFDRPHHSLSPEGLAQFEQKIIAAGESGDVYHRPGIVGGAAGSADRGFRTAGGRRWCAGHVRCLQTKTAE